MSLKTIPSALGMSTQHMDCVINDFKENIRRNRENIFGDIVGGTKGPRRTKKKVNSYAVPEQRQRISWLTSSQPTTPVSQNCEI